jgi:hypothetical protein
VVVMLASSAFGATNVTAVSYVNTTLVPGFSLISNPLVAQDNRVASLFGSIQQLPDRFSVFFLVDGEFQKTSFNAATRQFEPQELGNRELLPGEGVFVYNPGATGLLVTFAGTIPQGVLTNRIAAGVSMVSSVVPREAAPEEMSFPGEPGDVIYFFDEATQRFDVSIFDDIENAWLPRLKKLAVGKGFVVRKARAADWVQRFTVSGFAGQALTARVGDSSNEVFEWSEFFAPFPMMQGDSVSLSMELIPGGESLEVAVLAPSGDTLFALNFRNGVINDAVPYRADDWNEIVVNADVLSQIFELRVNGLSAGSFPFGAPASLVAPSITELRMRMVGFPGVTAATWIDNVKLSLQGDRLMELLEIDFDQSVPRFNANPGMLRKEARP